MASLGKTSFTGQSGEQYRFRVFPWGTRFRKISGVYVIANRGQDVNGQQRHTVLYVGNTEDFSQPFDKHHKADAFTQHGANCICVQSDASEKSRLDKQRDLVARFSPECND